jgi:hypothetical protein
MDPRDVVLSSAAGMLIANGVAASKGAFILRHNVDYESLSTWGCHESYLMRNQFSVNSIVRSDKDATIRDGLVAFLASRVCYGGAGGLAVDFGIPVFSLSPRLAYFNREVGNDTTGNRPILNSRDEPHARRGVRLHVICGDMLVSEFASWLRIGATALAVRLYDFGAGPSVKLLDACASMVEFSISTGAVATVLSGGLPNKVTSVDLQRIFLTAAKRNLGESWMPEWAAEVVASWEAALDAISSNDEDWMVRRLDWATKRALMTSRVEAAGWEWERMAALAHLMHHRPPEATSWRRRLELMDKNTARRGPKFFEAVGSKSASELSSDIADLKRLRLDLCEIDLRFGQVGGIADQMAGDLDYAISTGEEVHRRMTIAPDGRAKARGAAIKAIKSRADAARFTPSWSGILSDDGREGINFCDPSEDDGETVQAEGQPPPRDSDSQIFNEWMIGTLKAGDTVVLLEHAGTGRHKNFPDGYYRVVGQKARLISEAYGGRDVDSSGCAYAVVQLLFDEAVAVKWRVQSMARA